MNLFSIHRSLGLLCCFIVAHSLHAQRTSRVEFSYVADNKVASGSFKITFDLYKGYQDISFPDYIDYSEYDYQDLKIKVKVSDVVWASSQHAQLYKLAFGSEANYAHTGIRKMKTSTIYLYQKGTEIFSYHFTNVYEPTFSGIRLGFKVLPQAITYSDAIATNSSKVGILGAGTYTKGVLILPDEKYKADCAKDVDDYYRRFRKLNQQHQSKSIQFAQELADTTTDKTALKQGLLKTHSKSNFAYFFNNEAFQSWRVNAVKDDYEAYSNAKSRNTINAYYGYLSKNKKGRYAYHAKKRISKMLDAIPFEIKIDTLLEEVYKVHYIRFIKGVGNTKPQIEFSDNGRFGIKIDKWKGSKELVVKVPEGDTTNMKITLGRKDTTLVLMHTAKTYKEEIPTDNKDTLIAKEAKVFLQRKWMDKEDLQYRVFIAFLLAIPFLTAISYLLYRKHRI